MAKKILSPVQEMELIRTRLKHIGKVGLKKYLDTGSDELNSVFGNPRKGIPWGSLIELYGKNSSGKSSLSSDLMAVALEQDDDVYGFWVDAENSWIPSWQKKRGVDVDRVAVLKPYVGTFEKEKRPRLITAQELLQEAEDYCYAIKEKNPNAKFFGVVDSVTALLTKDEEAGRIDKQNLRTTMGLPAFMGKLLRRWVGTGMGLDMTVLFINQTRHNPMAMFQDPEYQPGGDGPKFYCHIRAAIRRAGNKRLIEDGTQIGIEGIIRNVKNKLGGIEFTEIGYRTYFSGDSEFMDKSKIKKDKKKEDQ